MRKAERRRHLLDCALEVFAQKGYHAASITDIIKTANVARGTFYLYFESKRAVFEELLDETLSALDTQIKRIDPSRGPSGVLAQMEANIDGVFTYFMGNKGMLRVLMSEAVGLDPGFDRKLNEFYGRLIATIKMALDDGKKMKLVKSKVNVDVAALCILGSIKEALYQQAMDAPIPKQQTVVGEILRYNVSAMLSDNLTKKLRGK